MKPSTTVGRFLGSALLVLAALAGVVGVVSVILTGVTPGSVLGAMVAFGLAAISATVGFYVRKRSTGNALPFDGDISVMFRGGQGGL